MITFWSLQESGYELSVFYSSLSLAQPARTFTMYFFVILRPLESCSMFPVMTHDTSLFCTCKHTAYTCAATSQIRLSSEDDHCGVMVGPIGVLPLSLISLSLQQCEVDLSFSPLLQSSLLLFKQCSNSKRLQLRLNAGLTVFIQSFNPDIFASTIHHLVGPPLFTFTVV